MLKLLFSFILGIQVLHACTAFQVQALDGSLIYCRSMEYGVSLDSALLIVPQGHTFQGTAPMGKPGTKWKTTYAYAGMNQIMNKDVVSDGMNAKGLVASSLYLRHFAEYEAPDEKRVDETLGPWELTSYLLGTCATVEEVKEALPNIVVAQQPVPEMDGYIIPMHFYVCDREGHAIVIEYVGGKRYVYDNPLGVLTNAPPFEWQMINLSTYANLAPMNVPPLDLKSVRVPPYGQGTGLLGLPGDYTPTSRFVRAAFFSQCATPQKTAFDAVCMGFHILNNFDLFEGIVRQHPHAGKVTGLIGVTNAETDTTQWTIVHDRTNLKTYFRGYHSLRIQMVDLTKLNFKETELKEVPLLKEFLVEDSTALIQPLQKRS